MSQLRFGTIAWIQGTREIALRHGVPKPLRYISARVWNDLMNPIYSVDLRFESFIVFRGVVRFDILEPAQSSRSET